MRKGANHAGLSNTSFGFQNKTQTTYLQLIPSVPDQLLQRDEIVREKLQVLDNLSVMNNDLLLLEMMGLLHLNDNFRMTTSFSHTSMQQK